MKSVVVTRMTANPTKGPQPPAEAVLTIGWGGVSRLDLEPASCNDPQCEADHGYTGVLASDDFSLRVSAAADGSDAVDGLLSFAESLSARTHWASMAEFVEPAYGRRSLGDVVPAVATALGVDGAGPSELELPGAASYVVFLVDGLGSRLLERYAHAAPYLSSMACQSATAGVPSTTVTSLTSFGTGLTPGTHGLVGFTSRIPGTDRLLNALWWDKDIDPLEWQPNATAFSGLGALGVRVSVVNKREFKGSGLTVAAHRGAEFVGADKVGERIAATVAASAERPSLTYVYDGDLDWTGHKYGVASSQWLQQLAMIDAEAEQLREALPGDRRLSWSPTTGWWTPRWSTGSTSTRSTSSATGWRCSVARRGSGTSTATGAPSATWWTPGPRCSVTGPTYSLARRRSREAGSGPCSRRCCPGWATSWWPAAATTRSSRPSTSPTRTRSSGCTARSRPTRC